MKGMWESLVHIRDEKASERTAKICSEAAWFEAHAPIDARFKKGESPRCIRYGRLSSYARRRFLSRHAHRHQSTER